MKTIKRLFFKTFFRIEFSDHYSYKVVSFDPLVLEGKMIFYKDEGFELFKQSSNLFFTLFFLRKPINFKKKQEPYYMFNSEDLFMEKRQGSETVYRVKFDTKEEFEECVTSYVTIFLL